MLADRPCSRTGQMQKLGKEHSDIRDRGDLRNTATPTASARRARCRRIRRCAISRARKRPSWQRARASEKTLKELLMPKDPNDEKNIILEIRAGTGRGGGVVRRRPVPHVQPFRGAPLVRSRSCRCRTRRRADRGVMAGTPAGAFAQLKYERRALGARLRHRGTGADPHPTATVAVMPEVRTSRSTSTRRISRSTMRWAGRAPVGQHDRSAVRVHHIPSGLIVHCRRSRSTRKGDGDEAARQALRDRGREAADRRARRAAARSGRAIARRRSAPATSQDADDRRSG